MKVIRGRDSEELHFSHSTVPRPNCHIQLHLIKRRRRDEERPSQCSRFSRLRLSQSAARLGFRLHLNLFGLLLGYKKLRFLLPINPHHISTSMAKQDTSETIKVDNLVTVVMCTLLSISDSLQPILHLMPTVWEHTDGPGPTAGPPDAHQSGTHFIYYSCP